MLVDWIAIGSADRCPLSNLLCRNAYYCCQTCSRIPAEDTANAPWEAL